MVHIITDSTACVPASTLKEFAGQLHVVPLKIILGERSVDEPTMTARSVFDYVKQTKSFPTTSQPAPGEFIEVFERIVSAGDTAVCVTLSSSVSGTYGNAVRGAEMVGKGKIFVVDSRSSSGGQWHFVQQALVLAGQGVSAADIHAQLTVLSKRNHIYILVDTLEYLHKGGRIGAASSFFGSILGIRPVLHADNGVIEVLDKARTQKRAMARIVEQMQTLGSLKWVGISHSICPEYAELMKNIIREKFADVPIEISQNGATIGVHFGPGTLAVFAECAQV
ncbi:MAG: DegV family protein [Negativicutes bacterium]|jgi:DegV family protein with EDD domain